MRTIKFRMWNNVKSNPSASRMFYDTGQVMECVKQQMLFDQGNKRLGYNHVGDGSSFMQFTGLTDKNGVEVFEGDMIDWNGSGFMLIVEWQGGCFVLSGPDYPKPMRGKTIQGTVKGNIHEQ